MHRYAGAFSTTQIGCYPCCGTWQEAYPLDQVAAVEVERELWQCTPILEDLPDIEPRPDLNSIYGGFITVDELKEWITEVGGELDSGIGDPGVLKGQTASASRPNQC